MNYNIYYSNFYKNESILSKRKERNLSSITKKLKENLKIRKSFNDFQPKLKIKNSEKKFPRNFLIMIQKIKILFI